jgi:CHAT domain-containing protein
MRRATAIHRDRAERTGATRSVGALKDQASKRSVFLGHVEIVETIIEREPKRRTELFAEAFDVGQLAQASSAAGAVARMSARFAAGNDALARTVRAYQDAVEQWQRLDARLVKAVSEPPDKRDATAEAGVRSELKALDGRIGDLDARLAREFPEYAALASPKPLSLSETQSLLGPGEALITYAVWDKSTFLWVLRHDDAAFHRLDIGRQQLDDAVLFVRAGLDQSGVGNLGDIRRFDVDEAVALYQQIFAPAEPMLEGVRHVFVVPDGALQSLPLGVLVTEMPEGPVRRMADYRNVPWLAKKYVMTVLPSVSSLRGLRRFAKAALASQPFIGFGDPDLKGDPGKGRSIDVAALFIRGAVADVDEVRELSRLPDTADELIALATAQGVGEEAIYLQARATETRVRSMDLSEYSILAFATHGLVAGDLKGVAEPALVLTPPETGTADDDGLLTASEIATLDLNADWVILSACNTAAADGTPGAEGLSGMAKAFF